MSPFMTRIVQIGVGLERMMYLLLTTLILQHVCACLWIFIARYDEIDKNNWIFINNYDDHGIFKIYMLALYFTVTTIMTVGYGDISAYNSLEMAYCIFLMLIGVVSFSYTTGALSSIIASSDSKSALLKDKLGTLHDIS